MKLNCLLNPSYSFINKVEKYSEIPLPGGDFNILVSIVHGERSFHAVHQITEIGGHFLLLLRRILHLRYPLFQYCENLTRSKWCDTQCEFCLVNYV